MFGLSQRRIACLRVAGVLVGALLLVILIIFHIPRVHTMVLGSFNTEVDRMTEQELDQLGDDYLLDNKYEDDFGRLQEAAEDDNIFDKMVVPNRYT